MQIYAGVEIINANLCRSGKYKCKFALYLQEGGLLDLNVLAKRIADHITNRPYLEKHHNTNEDDGLIGFLRLATAVMKHSPPFKASPNGQVCAIVSFPMHSWRNTTWFDLRTYCRPVNLKIKEKEYLSVS